MRPEYNVKTMFKMHYMHYEFLSHALWLNRHTNDVLEHYEHCACIDTAERNSCPHQRYFDLLWHTQEACVIVAPSSGTSP
jgi:hypothetical protein